MSDINVQSFSGKVKVSNDLTVTTNVHADYFKGDGSLLTNLPSGSGGVWNTNSDNEIYFISSNVGISNADPGHNLSVGSNLYVDDDGSNVLVVTGNVKADHFVGDGSLLTGLSGSGGVWSTNAANEIYFINNNVGISNADPGHNLSVGSNLYVDDDGLDVLVVTGNVNATYLKGNGSMITNLPSGSGGVWSTNADNEIYFISSNVGISNSNPGHNLSVGSNLYVDDDGSNVLVVDGNIAAESIVIGGISIVPSYPLSLVTETGNITPHTIQFTNATTGLVVSSNIVVTGNVTAAYLHGDASNVTAVPAAQITGTLDAARIPTLNQSTTGSAATLTTPRSIGGVNFDGSAAIVPTTFNGATFSGDVTVDSPTFHVDSTDNRVGVGTVSPATPFHISSTNEITTSPAGSSVSQMRYGSTNSTVLFGVSSTAGHMSAYDTSSFSTSRNLCFNADGGNVGIGTDSPDSLLNLYKNTTNGATMKFTSSGGYSTSIGQKSSSTADRSMQFTSDGYAGANAAFKFLTAGASSGYTEALTITGDGNVGIGTTDPTVTLDVAGSSSDGKSLQLRSGDIDSGTDSAQIIFSYANNSYNSGGYAHSIRTRHRSAGDGENAIDFWCWNTTDTTDANTLGNKRVMTIEGTGRVGIGTTSPGSSLHVNLGNAAGEQHIRATQTSLASSSKAGIRFGDSTWDAFIDHDHGDKDRMNFGFYRNPTREVQMVLTHEGNVGIGTTSPGRKLDVRTGDIRFGDNLANYDLVEEVDDYGGVTVNHSGQIAYNISTGNSSEGWCWRFVDSSAKAPGNDYFRVEYSTGNYWHKGTAISDRRTKTNFVSIDGVDALNSITKLNPLVYNDKTSKGGIDNRLKGGFIAQEVLDVIPHLVSYDEDRDKPNVNGYATAYALDYNGVFAYNVKATQEIYKLLLIEQAKVTSLEARILALENA
jgi:hypothetical protein